MENIPILGASDGETGAAGTGETMRRRMPVIDIDAQPLQGNAEERVRPVGAAWTERNREAEK